MQIVVNSPPGPRRKELFTEPAQFLVINTEVEEDTVPIKFQVNLIASDRLATIINGDTDSQALSPGGILSELIIKIFRSFYRKNRYLK